jgi:hypothetical protein
MVLNHEHQLDLAVCVQEMLCIGKTSWKSKTKQGTTWASIMVKHIGKEPSREVCISAPG